MKYFTDELCEEIYRPGFYVNKWRLEGSSFGEILTSWLLILENIKCRRQVMITEELEKLKKNNKIASFYTNENNTEKFTVGYVEDYDDDYFVLAMISSEGLYDGFALKETSSIIRISMDGKYEEKMLTLVEYHKTMHEGLEFKGDDFISEFLAFAKTQDYVVSVELLNSGFYDVQGYVETIRNDSCSIRQVTEYGEADGMAFVNYSDITQISCNSSDEMILKILSCVNGKEIK